MNSAESFIKAVIPRFDGHYDHWSMLTENFLWSKEHWKVVCSGIQEPPVTETQEIEVRKLKDLKAKNYLFQSIDHSILETILCKDTFKDI